MVVFAIQNVIKDPPFTKLDFASCRNLMIYLEPELQNRLIPAFHYALKVGGVLFLSASEGVGKQTDLFSPLDRKWKLYRALQTATPSRALMASGLSWATDSKNKTPEEVLKRATKLNFAELTQRTLLQSYAPASVVTDLQGNILYVHGETGKYLRPAPGQATLNVIEMAREGLQLELRAALNSVVNHHLQTLNREVSVKTNGDFQNVSLSVRPLSGPDANEGLLLLSFQDAAQPLADKPDEGRKRSTRLVQMRQVEELERDLAYTKENLQATIEEQQASNEELKSTNEEMQSTNEELQSTNEELETSKEELQSVNEELITVNTELQAKIEQLAGMQNDMKNLLDNINVGTVFLDQHLAIRRFTRDAARVYRLVGADVGRFLGDIKSNIEGGDLVAEAQTVLSTLSPYESPVHTLDGNSYLARMQPYRTLDNVIEGVVLTFTDITQRVAAEAAVQAVTAVQTARALAEAIVDTVREPLLVLDEGFKVVSASRSFYQYFEVTTNDTIGWSIYELGNRQWDIPALHELLETLLPRDQSFDDYTVTHIFPVIGERTLLLNARRLVGQSGDTALILLAMDSPPPSPHMHEGEGS
jgi:two-component system CheB/CheR fusion protein